MSFDPDAYIAESEGFSAPVEAAAIESTQLEDGGFDPDAYIAANEPGTESYEFDPDNYDQHVEITQAERLEDRRALSGRRSDRVRARITGQEDLEFGDTFSTMDAARDFYEKKPGKFHGAFYGLTIPEQFMARQAVGILRSVGMVDADAAKDLIARDQLHFSDIINYHWMADGRGERAGRFTTGLAADILLDPLTYVGVGVVGRVGRAVTLLGETVDTARMSAAQAQRYRALSRVENVIQKDGSMTRAQREVLTSAREGQIGLDDLAKNLTQVREMPRSMTRTEYRAAVRTEREAVNTGIRTELTKKTGYFEGLASGQRTVALHVPFTDISRTLEIPILGQAVGKTIGKTGQGIGALGGGFLDLLGIHDKVARASGTVGNASARLWARFKTKTGNPVFDGTMEADFSKEFAQGKHLDKLGVSFDKFFAKKADKIGSENYRRLADDIIEELDFAPLTKERAYEVLRRHKKVAGKVSETKMTPSKELQWLTESTTQDRLRLSRLQADPEVMDFIATARHYMDEIAEAHITAGIPFNYLDMFGKGWARNYFPRQINKKYLEAVKEMRKAGDEIGEGVKELQQRGLLTDKAQRFREYKGSAVEANRVAEAAGLPPVYINNPTELLIERIRGAQRSLRSNELLRSTVPYARVGADPGAGWVQFKTSDFARLVDETGDEVFANYVPQFFSNKKNLERGIWLPQEIYDRLNFRINGWGLSNTPIIEKLLNGLGMYTTMWRNTKLFGMGYVGLNATSNLLTYASYNGVSPSTIRSMKDATKVFIRKEEKLVGHTYRVRGADGKFRDVDLNQIAREATEDGVFTGVQTDLKFTDVVQHIASNRVDTVVDKTARWADTAFWWRHSRAMAEVGDNIPRLATYLHKRAQGFTREAAADVTRIQYFNYSNVGQGQDLLRKSIPFSTFPIKTAELISDTILSGKWAPLTVPGKVNAQLYGAYYPDPELRDALDQMLPDYMTHVSPIHGFLMAGMRQVLLEVPWLYNTLPLLVNADESVHPIVSNLKALGYLIGIIKDPDPESNPYADMDQQKLNRTLMENLEMVLPLWAREGLWQLSSRGIFDDGGYLDESMPWMTEKLRNMDKYAPDLPTASQFESYAKSDGDQLLGRHAQVHRFQNAYDFGEAMEDFLPETLFKFLFGDPSKIEFDSFSTGIMKDREGMLDAQRTAQRGEWIRRRFRQLTLGTARINALDRTAIFNQMAVQSRIARMEHSLRKKLNQNEVVFDQGRISEMIYNERFRAMYPEADEIIKLKERAEAIEEYYNFFLHLRELSADQGEKLLFGDYDEDILEKPDEEYHRRMFPRARSTPEDEALQYLEDLRLKTGYDGQL